MFSLRRRSSARVSRGVMLDQRRSRTMVAAGVSLILLSPIISVVPSAVAADLVPVVIDLAKVVNTTDHPAATYGAGDVVTYDLTVTCSSTQTDCVDMVLTDSLPDPLVFTNVTTNSKYSIGPATNGFELTFTTPLDEGGVGLVAGDTVTFQVKAKVADDVDAAFDGQVVTNTAYVTVSNPDSDVDDSADITIYAPAIISSSVTKTVTPSTRKAFAGQTFDFVTTATNTSNRGVDTLIIQDPGTVPSNAFDEVALTGISVTEPSADGLVQVDWYNGSIWQNGSPQATATLPAVPLTSIKGLRFTFTRPSGGLIAKDAVASVTMSTQTTSAVTALSSTFNGLNISSSQAIWGPTLGTVVAANAPFTITPAAIAPLASKNFSVHDVVGSQNLTATLIGTNGGDFSINSMVIQEPSDTTLTLDQQGLTFVDWVSGGISWPASATNVDVEFQYASDVGVWQPAISTAVVNTLPAPTIGEQVIGFRATFTGTMTPGENAHIPFTVTAAAVAGATDQLNRNEISVTNTTTTGLSATALAHDDLVRRAYRVNTTTSKSISPGTIWANPGTQVLLQLPSFVSPRPTALSDTGGSTVGATELIITDVDPDFWDMFDAATVVATAVPSNSSLTINYTTDGGGSWIAISTGLAGGSSYTTPVPAGANGIQFIYLPAGIATELPPGFSVQPNVRVTLRSTYRVSGDPILPVDAVAPVTVTNNVDTRVENPVATPPFATDADSAPIEVTPLPGGVGPGANMLTKAWAVDEIEARSHDTASLRIRWGTAGLQYDSVVVSDVSDNSTTAGDDPVLANVESSVYDAFNLVRIPAITSGMDPYLKYDQVSRVDYYSATSSSWLEVSGDPCPSSCRGTFPGYTLTAAEQADALGIRLVYTERTTRVGPTPSDPGAPLIGSGVSGAFDTDRGIDLQFQIRDTKRSDGTAVLGSTRHGEYNSYLANPVPGNWGLVVNTASIDAITGGSVVYRDTADDTILIIDTPIDVRATKTWVNGPLGLPPASTPQSLYPTAIMTVTAQNTSTVAVDQLILDEPTGGTSPFDYVNVYSIESSNASDPFSYFDANSNLIDEFSEYTGPVVVLTREGGGTDTYTLAQALALSSTNLADVVGIQEYIQGRQAAADETIGLVLRTQLRSTNRTTTAPISDTIAGVGDSITVPNTTTATIKDPGGVETPVAPDAPNNVKIDQASASIDIVFEDYDVVATKTISATSVDYGTSTSAPGSPAIQYDGSSINALVTLTGRSTGSIRTTEMLIEDSTPTFWNAYNFVSLDTTPLTNNMLVRVDVLVGESGSHAGTTYDISSGISTVCTVPGGCWSGDDPNLIASYHATPQLPANLPVGFVNADVRGLRFTYLKSDRSFWERPYNPTQTAKFTVERRTNFVNPSADPVPSTLFSITAVAPGETENSTFTNDVTVTGSSIDYGSNLNSSADDTLLYTASDTDEAQIRYQHLPAKVKIKKSPVDGQSLATDIPFKLIVTNTGGAFDKPLGALVITDSIPVELGSPLLVIGPDPDTEDPKNLSEVVSYRVANASNVTQATPAITAVMGAIGPTTQPITFTVDPAYKLPRGWTLTITVNLQFQPLLEAAHLVANTATVVADQPFDTCEYFNNVVPTGLQAQTPQTEVNSCTAATSVFPLASAPLTIVKGVRGVVAGPVDSAGVPTGEDDLGILKTVPGSKVDCAAGPNVSTGVTAAYYRYPCVPITRPGGTEEWANTFANGGNIGLDKLVAIDVLPAPNDTGVIVNETRESKWTPVLSTYPTLVNAPAGTDFKVYYLTNRAQATQECNGADIQKEIGLTPSTTPPMVTGYQKCLTTGTANQSYLDHRNWQLMPTSPSAALLSTVVAMKFVLDMSATNLASGSKISIVYRSTTAWVPEVAETNPNLANQSVAYNSIAAAAVGFDSTAAPGAEEVPNRFVTEPRKVGVALATGGIEVKKATAGAAASYAPANFQLSYSCYPGDPGYTGPALVLPAVAGVPRSPVTATANAGTPVHIDGLPLYAQCTVTEAAYNGATATFSPATVQAQAPQTAGLETIYNPHPAFTVIDRPAVELSTVTNTYDYTSLTIDKSIVTGGPLDQDGNPISYTNFLFTIKCSFNNGTDNFPDYINLTGQRIDQTTGTYTVNNVVIGSTCTVNETQSRGAQSIAWTATAAATTSGTTALTPAFTIGAGPNNVTYTNTFGVASITINKSITGTWATGSVAVGEAAHATGTFTVHVRCTRDLDGIAPTPDVVWEDNLTFSAGTVLTRTISNIPRGSNCAVNETDDAGATGGSNHSRSFNNISGSNTDNISNRFDVAGLKITKIVHTAAVDGDGDPVYLDTPYTVSVVCTFQGSTVYATGYTASPMVLTFSAAEVAVPTTKTLLGLPAGASCTVTEDNPPQALNTQVSHTTTAGSSTVPGLSSGAFLLTASTDGPDAGTDSDDTVTAATNSSGVDNFYDDGSLTLVKSPLGGGADQFAVGPFVFQVTCVNATDGLTTLDQTVELPTAGGDLFYTIDNIADNSTCDVVETDDGLFAADHLVYRNTAGDVFDGTGIDTTGVNPLITIENWYLTGSIEVTKTLAGDGADGTGANYAVGPFQTSLTCLLDDELGVPTPVLIEGGSTRTYNPSGAPGMTASYTNLPNGAECTLAETDAAGATSHEFIAADTTRSAVYTFTVSVDTNSLTDNQPQDAVTLENTFDLANLSVTKNVVANAVDQDGTSIDYGPFPVTISCYFIDSSTVVYADGYSDTTPMQKSLAEGETWNLVGLPADAVCSATEDSMDAASTDLEIVQSDATIADDNADPTDATLPALGAVGTTNSVEFTNNYGVGSLSLSKVVNGSARDDWGGATFTVTVICTLTDATSPGGREVWNEVYPFTKDTIGAVAIDNIAAGAVCDLTEDVDGTATTTVITYNGVAQPTGTTLSGVVIPTSATAVPIVYTNTFDYTEIDVTKTITGDTGILGSDGAALYGYGPFEVTLTCAFDTDPDIAIPGGATRTLEFPSYTAKYTQLPVGADCSIDETSTGGANDTTYNEQTFTTTSAPEDVQITNEFQLGSLEVNKTIDGAGSSLWGNGPFEVTLACTRDVNGDTVDVTFPQAAAQELNSANGYSVSYRDLPVGATCSITESKTGFATTTTVGDPVVITRESVATAQIDLTNEFELAQLSLTKATLGLFSAGHKGESFEISADCNFDLDGVATTVPLLGGDVREITAGEVTTFADLPAGTTCEFSETDNGGADMGVYSVASVPIVGKSVVVPVGSTDMQLSNLYLLAHTGDEPGLWILIALGFLGTGVTLVLVGRRRPRRS
jgi:large repetitive protein